ncbi:DUF3387 domain-containing protein [Brucepastera parasyntrophica]|uniref:type I restriction enzyme endonuclease domain-containing protein n=1 Tax=Brucepastera parasyntrophica TaxID=2880008 RepID=UPI00210ABFCB|nr:type I restriction enzyme endonuclease domain-containing protein [Brucepastera parasyntrophica]ULQ60420.1 DUF3387 domain-containing protein [Brucepastera parasyntrophica]
MQIPSNGTTIKTAAEIIEDFPNLSRKIKAEDKKAQTPGFTDFEYTFYTAIADNWSVRELTEKENAGSSREYFTGRTGATAIKKTFRSRRRQSLMS